MKLLSMKEAEGLGLKRYFTGKPCPRGHVAERAVSSRACIECAYAATRGWREGNQEHVISYQRSYTREHADRINARARANRKKNPEKTKARKAAEYQRNKEKHNARTREYYRNNREAMRKADRRKAEENPERYRSYKRNYKARKKKASGRHTAEDVMAIFKSQRGKCGYCRQKLSEGYHVDHIMALFNGGSNNRSNLQILCGPCNNSKSAKDPIDFARSKGMLL